MKLLAQFSSPVNVKGVVKSRENEWESASYIPDSAETAKTLKIRSPRHSVCGRRGVREYIKFKSIGRQRTEPIYEEYRVFYWQGKPFSIALYWVHECNQLRTDDLAFIVAQTMGTHSPFYTIDYAQLCSGKPIIIKIDDEQVPGLQGLTAEQFYTRPNEYWQQNDSSMHD